MSRGFLKIYIKYAKKCFKILDYAAHLFYNLVKARPFARYYNPKGFLVNL